MPLLDKDAAEEQRRNRTPSTAELAFAKRAIQDAVSNLNRPMVREALEAHVALAKESRSFLDKVAADAKPMLDEMVRQRDEATRTIVESREWRETQRTIAEWGREQKEWEERERQHQEMFRMILAPRVSPLETTIDNLRAEIADLRSEVADLRRPIAQTDLRTERMANYLQPPDDLDSPQAPADGAE